MLNQSKKEGKEIEETEGLVSWNDLDIKDMFLSSGGLYQKLSENKAFYFNGHSEIDVDIDENKDNKVFTRREK